MKRTIILLLAAFLLAAVMYTPPPALAADVCYPTAVEQSEDGREIRKIYDLAPDQDPAGIPRSDFEQNGIHYTLTDLLKQETPEYQERSHIEEVTLSSKSKDMETILSLLPQEKEFVTEDGLSGTLTLKLDTVQVETAGYGTSSKTVTTTRRYPNLGNQDTSYIPKTVEENGRTMTLQDISWQTDNTANMDDYSVGDRYTAVATYTGTATSSYVTGYTVTAKYEGTVSRIALDRVRYVAIFEGTEILPIVEIPEIDDPAVSEEPEIPEEPEVPEKTASDGGFSFNWGYVLVPLGVVILAGGGIGAALFLKRRNESGEESS